MEQYSGATDAVTHGRRVNYGGKGETMRLIDADALPRQKMLEARGNGQYEDVDIIYGVDVEAAPTIDPVPIIEEPVYLDTEEVTKRVIEKLAGHGRWDEEWLASTSDSVPGYRVWRCSECQNVSTWQTNYCPNCGALMRGTENETD